MKISYYKINWRNFSYQKGFMDENLRFVQILDELKKQGLITDYVQVSAELGTNKAGISDIKSGRKKLSVEILRRMKLSYPNVNLEWIITGVGEAFIANKQEVRDEAPTALVDRIAEQAEEIGRLREQIRQMQHRLEKYASDALTSGTANVG